MTGLGERPTCQDDRPRTRRTVFARIRVSGRQPHSMRSKTLTFSGAEVGLLVGTRVALGIGIGLLVAGRLDKGVRLGAGRALVALGAFTTIPFVLKAIGRRSTVEAAHDGPACAVSEGAHPGSSA